jgi:hypothetical protein
MTICNKVVCYYEPIGNKFSNESFELIKLWKRCWKNHGWDPVVLGEEDAKNHPRFNHIDIYNSHSNLHSCTPSMSKYATQCYLRWYAYANFSLQNTGTLWADYDVMNYGFTPKFFKQQNVELSCKFCGELASGYLSSVSADKIIDAFEHIYHTKDISHIITEMGDRIDRAMSAKHGHAWRANPNIIDMWIISSYLSIAEKNLCGGLEDGYGRWANIESVDEGTGVRKFKSQGIRLCLSQLPLIHFHGGFSRDDIKDYFGIPLNSTRSEIVNILRPVT